MCVQLPLRASQFNSSPFFGFRLRSVPTEQTLVELVDLRRRRSRKSPATELPATPASRGTR